MKNNQAVIFNDDFQIYQSADAIATESSSRSKTIKSFLNLEPRFSAAYKFNRNTSVKASYNRMSQYLHLLSNTSSPTPLDRKSTRLNSSHGYISYAVFCLKHTTELQSRLHIVCRPLLDKKKKKTK